MVIEKFKKRIIFYLLQRKIIEQRKSMFFYNRKIIRSYILCLTHLFDIQALGSFQSIENFSQDFQHLRQHNDLIFFRNILKN